MAQAFVTGGSGFIGRALVRRLIDEGHQVRALVRSPAAAASVEALGADAVLGDLTTASTYRDAVAGSEVFFHLAAVTDLAADADVHELITVQGTRAALDAAQSAAVPRFVLCGSEAALLAGDPLVDVDETAPLRPDSPAPYCAAKARSEQLVLDAARPGFATVSIRPRFVWGPDSNLIAGIAAAVTGGQFAWIDGSRNTSDVTYVDNAVEGLLLGWRHGRSGEAYFVTDDHRVELAPFVTELLRRSGVDAAAIDAIADLTADAGEHEVPVPARWFFGQPCTLRIDKASAELGYVPLVSHERGLELVRRGLAGSQS